MFQSGDRTLTANLQLLKSKKKINLLSHIYCCLIASSLINLHLHFKRVEVVRDGDTITTKEFFGAGKIVSNSLTFFVEAPFHYPDDKEGI
jgi:hypothetical protein